MSVGLRVLEPSVGYLRIFLLSLPFSFGLFALRSMLQGTGDPKTPLYFQLASVLLTTVLDPLLIVGRLGLPALGLNGTAWATLVSQVLLLVALRVYLHARRSPIAPRWPRFSQLGPTIRKTCRIGVPASVQQSVVSLGNGIINGAGAGPPHLGLLRSAPPTAGASLLLAAEGESRARHSFHGKKTHAHAR
ncbi:polysaccharide biosynthesis C-terminal domain-containing protein [Sorangium sp. So ce429]